MLHALDRIAVMLGAGILAVGFVVLFLAGIGLVINVLTPNLIVSRWENVIGWGILAALGFYTIVRILVEQGLLF